MTQSQFGGPLDVSEKATDLKDRVTDQIKNVAGQAEGFARQAVDQLGGASAGEVAGNLKGALDKSLEHQPMATLAMAACVGFVLGALWKS